MIEFVSQWLIQWLIARLIESLIEWPPTHYADTKQFEDTQDRFVYLSQWLSQWLTKSFIKSLIEWHPNVTLTPNVVRMRRIGLSID